MSTHSLKLGRTVALAAATLAALTAFALGSVAGGHGRDAPHARPATAAPA